MNILVCFKITPDLEKIVEADWQDFSLDTDLRYASQVLNCFDESALETALRLKEQLAGAGKASRCTALTLGHAPSPSVWQTLYAAGFDEVKVLEAEAAEFAPAQVAQQLAKGAEGYDLIFTGRQSPMGDTASVPFLLAEMLGIPAVPEAETVQMEGEDLAIECAVDEGRARLLMAPPVIVAVGNSPVAALRAVTLRSKLQAAQKQVESAPAQLMSRGKAFTLSAPQARGQCEWWPAEDTALAAARLREYLGGGEGE